MLTLGLHGSQCKGRCNADDAVHSESLHDDVPLLKLQQGKALAAC